MRVIVTCLACALAAASPAWADPIEPGDAADHVGEQATVCGDLKSGAFQSRNPGRPTYLHFGAPFPNPVMVAVIFGNDRAKFGEPETLVGQRLCVTGTITLLNDTPMIVLSDPSQLTQ